MASAPKFCWPCCLGGLGFSVQGVELMPLMAPIGHNRVSLRTMLRSLSSKPDTLNPQLSSLKRNPLLPLKPQKFYVKPPKP